ncbi:MAG: phosphate ABC transporter permease PstA [Myxococcales bacterium]|nr:phosphate ABC transporter permease PstA [Myxococcales bacterium]
MSLALGLLTVLLAAPTLIVLAVLVYRGAPALSLDFLLSPPRAGMTAGGIFPAIVGTFYLVGLSLLVSVPLGVMGAVYLTEYARPGRLLDFVHLAIVNLAGVPSIVHALFGVGAFVVFMRLGTSILAASLTLAVMNLPIVIAATRESLLAVPYSFRQASWALGASRAQTVWHIVLPNALPGILTGVVFAVSRAAGETAPILFTGVAFYLPSLPNNVFDQCMALSMHLFTITTQVVGVPESYPAATALVLIALVLSANAVSVVLRSRHRKNRRW